MDRKLSNSKNAMRVWVLIWSLCVFSNKLIAATDLQIWEGSLSSAAYLLGTQNGDGSWGDGISRVRHTNEALLALNEFGVSGLTINRGSSWLYNVETFSIDEISRIVYSLGVFDTLEVSQINRLRGAAYDSVVGYLWGSNAEYLPTTLDHTLAIMGQAVHLESLGAGIDASLTIAWSVLLSNQRTGQHADDGFGWGYSFAVNINGTHSLDSSVVPTAYVILTMLELARIDPAKWGFNSAILAIDWLVSQQNFDSSFSERDGANSSIVTALAARAIILAYDREVSRGVTHTTWKSAYDNAIGYLLSVQTVDGSWNDDAYTTALANRALYSHFTLFNPAYPPVLDSDTDGISDALEIYLGTNPSLSDAVFWERNNGLLDDYFVTDRRTLTAWINTALLPFDVATEFGLVGDITLISGQFPQGVTLNSGVISGIPTSAGVYNAGLLIKNVVSGTGYGTDSYIVTLSFVIFTATDDFDQDGMSASFEQQYGLNDFDSTDADIDTDGDGVTNIQEFMAGTDPSDINDFPAAIVSSPLTVAALNKLYVYPIATNVSVTDINLSAGPTGMFINANRLYWVPTEQNLGNHLIEITLVHGTLPTVPQEFVLTVASPTVGVGDVNADGVVNLGDVILVERDILGMEALLFPNYLEADVAPLGLGDGEINAADLLLIKQAVLQGRAVFLDADNDLIDDAWEARFGLNPAVSNAGQDSDTDGLLDVQEFDLDTDPMNSDTDGDGLIDSVDPDPLSP